MSKQPDFSYVNSNGKPVRGPAAFLHHVYTEMGGIQEYNDEVGKIYLEEFVREHSEALAEHMETEVRRKRIKFVG